MNNYSLSYPGRHRIVRWVESNGRVLQAEGYYCTNGDQHGPDKPNILDSDGNSAPNWNYQYGCNPMYYFPETGYSTDLSATFDTELEAVTKALSDADADLMAAVKTVNELRSRQAALLNG